METIIKELLIEFKVLPKYQLERRIDIFILEKLSSVFTKKLNKPISFIYPEFPLQSLNINSRNLKMDKNLYSNLIHLEKRATNHNTNVDYLLASKSTFYFVELKTDSNSFKKPSQLLYYAHYIDQPYADLYNFFKDNLAVDNQDPKWKDGLDYLQRTYKSSFSSDIESNLNNELKLIYLAPSKVEKLKEYQLFKKQLGEKLIFMSLKDFGSLIDDDDVLSDLLIEIDKIEIE